MKWLFVAALLTVMSAHPAYATDLDCVSTTFNLLSPNDKVCVSVFEDTQVPGVACHISQARKGGWGQPLGLNEDLATTAIWGTQQADGRVSLRKVAIARDLGTTVEIGSGLAQGGLLCIHLTTPWSRLIVQRMIGGKSATRCVRSARLLCAKSL